MKNIKSLITCFLLLLVLVSCKYQSNETALKAYLNNLDSIRFKPIEDSSSAEAYEVFIKQPLDHSNPEHGYFNQRFFIFHKSRENPVIMVTEGYNARPKRHAELTYMLEGNEINIEHRYFDESAPDSIDWKYLTTKQAAEDHHRIFQLLKPFYKNKWISTGISKGGQTTIFYKYYFPNDVDAWVPYVAPLNFEQEDQRILTFLKNVGNKKCRNKVFDFEKLILQNREKMIPLLAEYSNDKNLTFDYDLNKILEHTVLEFSFSFWQWANAACSEIPTNEVGKDSLFNFLVRISDPAFFSNNDGLSGGPLLPFTWQAYTEMGFYGYETSFMSDLVLSDSNNYLSNLPFLPQAKSIRFNKELMPKISDWIKKNGNNMIYIYGGNDPWSATSVNIGRKTNSLKMVLEGGSHRTRIRNFSQKDKKIIYDSLESWLGFKIPKKI